MGVSFGLVLEVGLWGGRWGLGHSCHLTAAAASHLLSHVSWLLVIIPWHLSHLECGLYTRLCPCKHTSCKGQKSAMSCPCAGLGNPGSTWRPAPCLQAAVWGNYQAAACSQQGSTMLKHCALERISRADLARANPAQSWSSPEVSPQGEFRASKRILRVS